MDHESRPTRDVIDELVRSTGASGAEEAVRRKARELTELYVASFGEPTMPVNVEALAGLRGIHWSDDRPFHSPDAEIAPDGRGGVTMRVNRDRPETRQRFSAAHEISHTFFAGYTTKVWCRTDARYRQRSDPADRLEMLCDVGAAELLFPDPWFSADAQRVTSAADLVTLASTYRASREATLRRFAEQSSEPLAVVFFIWKIKPKQKGTVSSKDQRNLFGISAEELLREALRLRIDYAIPSPAFKDQGYFLPPHKSVENDGPIYHAASTGIPADEEWELNLGPASGRYRVSAIPLWTADDQRGGGGENGVAAVLRPLSIGSGKRKAVRPPQLFSDI